MKDYLTKFTTSQGFDLFRLLDEDFLKAFKLCWNDKKYASATKLLVSFIDTLAYLEFGDEPRNFQRWLDTYATMTKVGVTADELWEFRNAILHMTSPHSRKVRSGMHPILTIYIGQVHPNQLPTVSKHKALGVWQLYSELEEALCKWAAAINGPPNRMSVLIDRYDQVISDARYLEFIWDK